LFVVRVAIIK